MSTATLNETEPLSRRVIGEVSYARLLEQQRVRPHSSVFWHGVRTKRCVVERMRVAHTLHGHEGCVNVVNWSECGQFLISGSDDCALKIWKTHAVGAAPQLLSTLQPGHVRNIFTAHFVPHSNLGRTVSGGLDQLVRLHDVERNVSRTVFAARELVSKIVFVPWQPDCFYTCAYDGLVRFTDLRLPHAPATTTLLSLRDVGCPLQSASQVAFDPVDARQFVLAGGDHRLRVFDVRRVDSARHAFSLSSSVDFESDVQAFSPITPSGVDWGANGLIAATYSGRPALIFDVHRDRVRVLLDAAEIERAAELATMAATSSAGTKRASASADDAAVSLDDAPQRLCMSEGDSPISEVSEDIDSDDEGSDDDDSDDSGRHENSGAGAQQRAAQPTVHVLEPVRARLHGHDNRQTFLKEIAFFNDEFVVTGSDCGHVYFWHIASTDGAPINVVHADDAVVNGVKPHPHLPLIATCGIDSSVKILECGDAVTVDADAISELVDANNRDIRRARETEARFVRFYRSGLAEFIRRHDTDQTDSTGDESS
jgi:WD40 repeat protein